MNPVLQLGDVASTVMGQAPAGKDCNKAGNGYPFVKAGEFSADRPVIREWTTNPLKKAKEGDVLVCVVGATAGKVNLGIDCAIGRSVADDPKGIAKNVAGVGRWGNGEVELGVASLEEVPYALSLIRQSLERQLEGDS